MKILLLGVFSPSSTDSWKARALSRLGHRVTPFPYRERDWRELHGLGEPWDLAFVSKGVPLPVEAFARLTEISKARLLWWPDPFENWTAELTAAVQTGSWKVSATSVPVIGKILAAAKDYRGDSGVCRYVEARWFDRILEGCDCEGPRPDWAPKEIKPALLHFGHLSERRVAIIERLRAAGVTVDHLDVPLYGAALQRKVLEYAAVLGVNTSPDLYSNRVQTVLAMGGVMLTETAPGIGSLGEDFFPMGTGGVNNGLFTWGSEAALLFHARACIDERDTLPRTRVARLIWPGMSWESQMERALDFACAEVSEMRFTESGSTGGTPAGDQIGPVTT